MEELHSRRGASCKPRSRCEQNEKNEKSEKPPAPWLSRDLQLDLSRVRHSRPSRRESSSGPVRVISPAPIVKTTSPSRTESASAVASEVRGPSHAGAEFFSRIFDEISCEVTPSMGCSRAGYRSERKTKSAFASADANSGWKSRVRE